jgi:FkbM family methyltransferase
LEELVNRISTLYRSLADGSLAEQDTIELPSLFNDVEPTTVVKLYNDKTVSEEDTRAFSRFTAKMGTILDIGAHWGYTAISFRSAGTDCPILSFEALNAHKRCLAELKKIDGNYDFHIGPLSDKKADVQMYNLVAKGIPLTGINSIGGATLVETHVKIAAEAIVKYYGVSKAEDVKIGVYRTRTRTLDDVLATEKFAVPVKKIIGVKIDVEGHEVQVLRGGAKTINESKPLLMLEYGTNFPILMNDLKKIGYKHGTRVEDRIEPSDDLVTGVNHFFYHPDHLTMYQEIGLMSASPAKNKKAG